MNEDLEHHVPAALATDDEGVLRIDITDEFVRAVIHQRLPYRALKQMVRASLEHSFLPGSNLWKVSGRHGEAAEACADDALGDPPPSGGCAIFLDTDDRPAFSWSLMTAGSGATTVGASSPHRRAHVA